MKLLAFQFLSVLTVGVLLTVLMLFLGNLQALLFTLCSKLRKGKNHDE